MKTILKALVIGGLLTGMAAFAGGALDGKTFKGKMKKADGVEKDKLVFKDGKFTSTECVQYGFKATDYEAKQAGDATEFTAVATNETGAKMSWSGTVKGDKIDAKAVWSHEGEASKNMSFSGKSAKAKK